METQLLKISSESVALAAQLLRQGEVVGTPTETVYGLMANACSEEAVLKIFEAKGRPQDNPLIVHVCDLAMLREVAAPNEQCLRLAEAFWPGPLTMILPKLDTLPAATCAGMPTVAIRMPSNPVALAVIRQSGLPLAGPSANLSGSPSPTNAADVMQDMQGRIPLILDGGPCEVGVESTVISLSGETPVLFRPGYITKEQMEEVLGCEVQVAQAVLQPLPEGQSAPSPGMKYKHYAPKAEVTILRGSAAAYRAFLCGHAGEEGLFALCFEEEAGEMPVPCVTYGNEGNAASQARHLFTALRELDKEGAKKAYAHFNGKGGVYLAVYNRLLRAAAFRVIDL